MTVQKIHLDMKEVSENDAPDGQLLQQSTEDEHVLVARLTYVLKKCQFCPGHDTERQKTNYKTCC